MPTYEYKCRNCERKFTVEASIKEKSKGLEPKCPDCRKGDVFQVFTSVGVIGGNKSGNSGSCSTGSCGTCNSC